MSPLKRLKALTDTAAPSDAVSNAVHGNADDAEVARRLHEQLNGPESPTNAPLVRHITRQRKAPVFYKPEACLSAKTCSDMLAAARLHSSIQSPISCVPWVLMCMDLKNTYSALLVALLVSSLDMAAAFMVCLVQCSSSVGMAGIMEQTVASRITQRQMGTCRLQPANSRKCPGSCGAYSKAL